LLISFWKEIMRRRLDRFTLYAELLGFGAKVKGGKVKTETEARQILQDPLADFPNDLDYFTDKEIEEKLRYASQRRARAHPRQLYALWTTERAQACRGNDPVARRASMNDVLWGKYEELHRNGRVLTLEQLKCLVEVDVVRSRLYPNLVQLSERHRYERAHKLPLTVGDSDKPPPAWFVEQLQTQGELEHIVNELRRLSGGERSPEHLRARRA